MTKPIKISKVIGICLLLLSFNTLAAQDFKNSPYNQRIISINPGYVFSGSGDCWGINTEISHFKSFSPRLFHRQSLEGWIANGDSWIDGGFENQTGLNIACEIGIVPFKSGEQIFYLAGGATLGYISNISPNSGHHFNFTSSEGVQSLNWVNYDHEFNFTPGFTLSAGYITKVNSKIYLNIRAQTKVFNSGVVLSTLSVGIGLNALNR